MDIESLSDFVAVVDAGSISAGARLRRQPKQSVSRRLILLEEELGVRLLDRSTRRLSVTTEGAMLLTKAKQILESVEEAKRSIHDRINRPTGLLRISAPVLFGQTLLGDLAVRFANTYPDCRLEFILANRRVDLIEEGFEAAIRVGPLGDSNLFARRFAVSQNILVAAPQWVGHVNGPQTPEILSKLPCIIFGEGLVSAPWRLVSNGQPSLEVEPKGQFCVSCLKLALDIARSGGGVAFVPEFLARPDIDLGTLVQLLPEWRGEPTDLQIVYSSRRFMSLRLRAFVDLLTETFRGEPL